jgi:hypothetical protein
VIAVWISFSFLLLYNYPERVAFMKRLPLVLALIAGGMTALLTSMPAISMQTIASDEVGSVSPKMPGFQLPLAASITVSEPQKSEVAELQSDESANCSWSLPPEGAIGIAGGAKPQKPRKQFDVSIDLDDGSTPIGARLEQLMDIAWEKDAEGEHLDEKVAHYRTKTQRAVAKTKDTVDYVVPFRGFGPSSEAGDVILGEKIKLKSQASAEFARQKRVDEMHLHIANDVMQIAMGLGQPVSENSKSMIETGVKSLGQLVGNAEAQETLTLLNSWTRAANVPQSVFNQPLWDVAAKNAKVQQIIEESVKTDSVLEEIVERVHKYNHHSKLSRASAHVIQATLGVASLCPDLIGPIAKATQVTYIVGTGGPEQSKLMKELYLDKRFDSRWKVLNEQAHLAVENYQVALLTHNTALLIGAESLVEQMAGQGTVKKVFGSTVTSGTLAETAHQPI